MRRNCAQAIQSKHQELKSTIAFPETAHEPPPARLCRPAAVWWLPAAGLGQPPRGLAAAPSAAGRCTRYAGDCAVCRDGQDRSWASLPKGRRVSVRRRVRRAQAGQAADKPGKSCANSRDALRVARAAGGARRAVGQLGLCLGSKEGFSCRLKESAGEAQGIGGGVAADSKTVVVCL